MDSPIEPQDAQFADGATVFVLEDIITAEMKLLVVAGATGEVIKSDWSPERMERVYLLMMVSDSLCVGGKATGVSEDVLSLVPPPSGPSGSDA
ncbi:hypothetical protein CC2G_003300 [Coprinopsis cinerea AmutBmut pab1-1]|nr:hypothetical protein CC2G_003300 [Coprinopsis cinerea AmutBmut pab1-1]